MNLDELYSLVGAARELNSISIDPNAGTVYVEISYNVQHPEVAAVPAVLDDAGNVVTPEQPGKAAWVESYRHPFSLPQVVAVELFTAAQQLITAKVSEAVK